MKELHQVKIRSGFVTNSSSTNFLIISKEQLSKEYLLDKLGFSRNSKLLITGKGLVDNILIGIDNGVRYHNLDEINYDFLLETFGEESAKKYLELEKQGYFTYVGYTQSDDEYITSFMTTDSFLINDKDFYMNGLNCMW